MKAENLLRIIRIASFASALLASFASLGIAWALERPGMAIVEGRYAEVTLEDLEGDGSVLRGKHFVVVRGRGEDPLPLELPASQWHVGGNRHYHQNVYYHLTRARKFFIERFGATGLQDVQPMIVRIDSPQEFSPAARFRAEAFAQHYNDSVTVPASDHLLGEGVEPWGVEIWFRPPREEPARSSFEEGAGQINSREFKSQMHVNSLRAQATAAGSEYALSGGIDFRHNAFQAALSVGLWELVPLAFAGVAKITQGTQYIDTAVVPQIVAHEYAHSVFAKNLGLSNTPVTEGFADYFAAAMGEARYDFTVDGYSRSNLGKNAKKRERFDPRHERFRYSTSDFTLSALWMLREELGEEVIDPLVFRSREHLKPGATIRGDLVRALGLAAKDLHSPEEAGRIRLEILRLLRARKGF